MKKTISLITLLFIFSGCAVTDQLLNKKVNSEPEWLLDPYYKNDKIAAVGCSKPHFKGEEAQKNLAISRAIDQIATQKKVTVDNATYRQKSSSNGRMGNSSSQSSSLQTVDKVSLSTKTKAIYKKPNGDICAWVVAR